MLCRLAGLMSRGVGLGIGLSGRRFFFIDLRVRVLVGWWVFSRVFSCFKYIYIFVSYTYTGVYIYLTYIYIYLYIYVLRVYIVSVLRRLYYYIVFSYFLYFRFWKRRSY